MLWVLLAFLVIMIAFWLLARWQYKRLPKETRDAVDETLNVTSKEGDSDQ